MRGGCWNLSQFQALAASPPCQDYSVTRSLSTKVYPRLVEDVRSLFQATALPYAIENVPGAPLINPVKLCGTMFGLRVIRHRLFETRPVIWWPPHPCNHDGKSSGNHCSGIRKDLSNFKYLTIVGHDYKADDGRKAMGIDWMTRNELSEAIPPAYTEWIGGHLYQAAGQP